MIAEAELKANVHNRVLTDLVASPTESTDPTDTVRAELSACVSAGIEVVSVLPEWVELKVPCDRAAIPPLQKLITQLDADLSREVGEAISYAFREMLSNAIEYGGQLNPEKTIKVRWLRLKRAVICRIKDPGDGFDPTRLDHAAISNPNTDPIRHASVATRWIRNLANESTRRRVGLQRPA
jgi:signal transduction histidine kinase